MVCLWIYIFIFLIAECVFVCEYVYVYMYVFYKVFFKVSVPGLERALEQYVTNGEYDKPFDLKVVPISTLPLSETEVKKPSLSVEIVADKKKEKKVSRQEIYAGLCCTHLI